MCDQALVAGLLFFLLSFFYKGEGARWIVKRGVLKKREMHAGTQQGCSVGKRRERTVPSVCSLVCG